MNEIRSYASLSGSLLARKGAAKPAMRPRPLSTGGMLDDLGWDDMGDDDGGPSEHVPSSIAALTPAPKAPILRDEPEPVREAPVQPVQVQPIPVPPVHVQQRVLAEQFREPEPAEQKLLSEEVVSALRAPVEATQSPILETPAAPTRPLAIKAVKKAAFTLRLDPERHLKLRVATALTGTSAQQLVTAALDQFLTTLPELGSLAEHLPARAGTNR
jgi:predicted HicB family RNase H-like nuclease